MGGFWIANQKVTEFKKGYKFKKGDILAKDEKFFKGKGNSAEYIGGHLTKVAIHSGYFTHKDSSLVTEDLGKKMTSYITLKKDFILGKNANIIFLVKKGQIIEASQPIIKFEESFNEKEANQLLDKLGNDEIQDIISDLGTNIVTSKVSGVVEDIKIYYTADMEEMSPSLQKIVKSYSGELKKKEKIINQYLDKDGQRNIFIEPSKKIESTDGKIKGIEVGEGVLIEVYIKYRDEVGEGDKILMYTALKSVIGEKVSDELAPYSEYHPEEQISAVMSPISIFARQTASVYLALLGNKALIELKRKVKDIYSK